MHTLRRLGTAAVLAAGLVLIPLAASASALSFPPAPSVPRVYIETAACTAAGGHNMSATSKRMYVRSNVTWGSVALDATRETWFRIDLLVHGRIAGHPWRGIRNGRRREAAQSLFAVAPAGSKLYITAFFANGSSCSVTETS